MMRWSCPTVQPDGRKCGCPHPAAASNAAPENAARYKNPRRRRERPINESGSSHISRRQSSHARAPPSIPGGAFQPARIMSSRFWARPPGPGPSRVVSSGPRPCGRTDRDGLARRILTVKPEILVSLSSAVGPRYGLPTHAESPPPRLERRSLGEERERRAPLSLTGPGAFGPSHAGRAARVAAGPPTRKHPRQRPGSSVVESFATPRLGRVAAGIEPPADPPRFPRIGPDGSRARSSATFGAEARVRGSSIANPERLREVRTRSRAPQISKKSVVASRRRLGARLAAIRESKASSSTHGHGAGLRASFRPRAPSNGEGPSVAVAESRSDPVPLTEIRGQIWLQETPNEIAPASHGHRASTARKRLRRRAALTCLQDARVPTANPTYLCPSKTASAGRKRGPASRAFRPTPDRFEFVRAERSSRRGSRRRRTAPRLPPRKTPGRWSAPRPSARFPRARPPRRRPSFRIRPPGDHMVRN